MAKQSIDLSKIQLRPAAPDDAHWGARLLFDSFPKVATFILGLGSEERAKVILQRLFQIPGHRFSFQTAYVAAQGDRVIGLLSAFPGRKLGKLDRAMARHVLRQYQLRGKLALLIRAWPLVFIKEADADSLLISNLSVRKRWRGQGVGGLMLDYADGLARDEGLDKVSLIVAIENKGARNLYEKHGFRVRAMHLESNRRVPYLGAGYQQMVKTLADENE
jgi:ribosomal protein S18 acetylase RimI-like enzyme